jgi:hypothetical protein
MEPIFGLYERQLEKEENAMHFSEVRDTYFGPPPNPERAAEAPATRHLPSEPTGGRSDDKISDRGRKFGS